MPVLKPVHRSHSTNQSCVQRSQNLRNFEKLYYFVFKFLDSQHKISIVYDCLLMKTFFIYLTVQNRIKAFRLKVTCKELKLVFVHEVNHVNTECT